VRLQLLTVLAVSLVPAVVSAQGAAPEPVDATPARTGVVATPTEGGATPTPPPAATAVVPGKPEPSLDDICKIDPKACPTLDKNPGPSIELNGPIAAAPAVRAVRGDVGSKVSERFVMPAGYTELGGELALITSDAVVTKEKLGFGDLALFRPSARRSFGDRVELSLGSSLLAKQPTGGHEWIWQGLSLGALVEPWDGYGFTLSAGGGPLLGGAGSVWSAAPGVAAKWSLDRDARVLLSLSDDLTALDGRGKLGARSWLDEVALGGEVQLGHREAAAWLGVDYAVPVAKHGEQPLSPTPLALRPAVRLDLQVGGVVRVGDNDDWDLFAYYAWIDRGALAHPATLLPVLDGGFDQHQVVLGIHHRFGHHRSGAYEVE
jgi:hypothetical protein